MKAQHILLLLFCSHLFISNSYAAALKKKPELGISAAIEKGRKLIDDKKYRQSVLYFYNLIYNASDISEPNKLISKYYLGLALNRSQLYQTASFSLLSSSLSSDKKLSNKSFEQLVKAADALNDQSLLDYSFKKTNIDNITEIGREYFYNNLAKISLDASDPKMALSYVDKTLFINPENEEATYLKGLAYIKQNDNAAARPALEKIFHKYEFATAENSQKKDEATVALARANYNLQNWKTALDLYRKIPKDSRLYRQVLLEISWTYFRSNQFRSALSTIHSLNTPYYENFYDPESLVLRSIILLFICQPSDLEKSISFFNRYYVTAYDSLKEWNSQNYNDEKHFIAVEKVLKALSKNKNLTKNTTELPYFIFRSILEDPEVRVKVAYLNNIKKEQIALKSKFNVPAAKNFKNYSNKILNSRIRTVALEVGSLVKNQLQKFERELSDYITQFDFINYEYLDLKKNLAAQKTYETPQEASDGEKETRQFYIQSGFQYYPFEGEYWRDEIGNYQYLGKNQCGKNE